MLNFFLPNLKERSNDIELMDIPTSNEEKLINTVKQFSILNYLFTNSRKLIKKYILSDMLKIQQCSYELLDIGSGGCDIAIWLLKECRKKKLNIRITCIDNDSRIIRYTQKKCMAYKEIKVIEASAFNISSLQKFDYIFANHFLHHLTKEEIPKIIDSIADQTNKIFLLNDILRSKMAYLGYTLFTGVFMHNSFAFYDGRLSIKKGFLESEMRVIVNKSRFRDKIIIGKENPARIYLVGRNSN